MKFFPVVTCALLAAFSLHGVEFTPSFEQPPGMGLERVGSIGPALAEGIQEFQPEWRQNQEGKYYLETEAGASVYGEGLPLLPVRVQRIQLPSHSKARLELVDWTVSRSGAEAPLVRLPKEPVWSPNVEWEFPPEQRGRLFPGRLVSARQEGQTLVVQWFPLQLDRATGELWHFENVRYRVNTQSAIQRIVITPHPTATSLILTTADMKKGALSLQQFHRRELGIDSQILFVENLEAVEKPVDEATLPPGYKTEKDKSVSTIYRWDPRTQSGYHYDRARKITAFLRRRMGGALKYVTLLGDASRIPPSYYYGMRSAFGAKFTPTDACYAAEDKCLAPRLAVGRLPFGSPEAVDQYLVKVKDWLREAPQAKHELALYGGKAFRGTHYIGEVGTARLLDYGNPGWRGAVKYHRTSGTYRKAALTGLAQGHGEAAFVYHLDHGLGNRWYAENQYVTSAEISAMTDAPRGITPWIASISCVNGAFDEGLVRSAGFGPSSQGTTSIGVSLLRSPVGAVAYLGSARPAIGQPMVVVDEKGNLTVKATSYGLRLMDTFYRHYHDELGGRAGDRWLQTLQSYAHTQGHDMTQSRHLWTYFNVVLLGDPTLRFPIRKNTDPVFPLAESLTKFDITSWGLPVFNSGEELYTLSFRGPAVKGRLLKVEQNSETLVDSFQEEGTFGYELEGKEAQGRYLLKLENGDGVPRERRVWFAVD